MTIQNLKDNRFEIIQIISENADSKNMATIMSYLVSNLDPHASIMFLDSVVNEAIDDLGMRKAAPCFEMSYEGVTYYHFDDYQQAVNSKLKRSI
jgi:hypothetical protein